MDRNAFTLTEILIVVIIIAILVALALPMFVKALEKAKVSEAINNLNFIRSGQNAYFPEYSTFSSNIDSLPIEDPNNVSSRYFDYMIESADSSDFTAQAERRDGPCQGDTYTIHKDGKIEGPLI